MNTSSMTGLELAGTSRYGSPELVKMHVERGARFEPFNEAFVRVYVKRPPVDSAAIRHPLDRLFSEGGPSYRSPILIGRPHYDIAVAQMGFDPITKQVA